MKVRYLTLFLVFSFCFSHTQNGKIISKEVYKLHDTIMSRLKGNEHILEVLDKVKFSKITYLSDGLRVTGYISEPKKEGVYPCIIANRGGNREFGAWNPYGIAFFLGEMASWNYVVVASQYRGNDGGEGQEEFGGKDVNDVLNLIPLLKELPNADTSRIGIEGGSRGGMMTYLALKRTCDFKAAAVVAGAADSFTNITSRPEMEKYVYSELIPNYFENKEKELKTRSAIFWADEMCKTTPLLILHGSADWRVLPTESMTLVNKLYEAKHPTRFILFEGADHGIREYRSEVFAQVKRHFDYYVRDLGKLPNMEPHGR